MMKIPYSKEHLMEAQLEVVRANKLESCYLRPIAFYGSEKMGVSPRRAPPCMSPSPPGRGAPTSVRKAWRRASASRPSSFARHHVNVTMPRAKVATTYANSILANLEATQDGYDEALLLDTDGFVAEGAGENLFIIKNGVIYEPRSPPALTGITRETIIALAAIWATKSSPSA
jgi:branched-chain amino acid aminotransferase